MCVLSLLLVAMSNGVQNNPKTAVRETWEQELLRDGDKFRLSTLRGSITRLPIHRPRDVANGQAIFTAWRNSLEAHKVNAAFVEKMICSSDAAQKVIPGLLLLVRMLTSELVAQTISEVCQKARIAGNTDVESLKALATTLKALANNSPLMKPATTYLAAATSSFGEDWADQHPVVYRNEVTIQSRAQQERQARAAPAAPQQQQGPAPMQT